MLKKFVARLFQPRERPQPQAEYRMRGRDPVTVTLTPQVAREVHRRAREAGFADLVALVAPAATQDGEVEVAMTVADRSMIRRLMRDATVV